MCKQRVSSTASGRGGGGGELHTHSKVEVQEDKLLVRLQYAVDELADAEELHLLS